MPSLDQLDEIHSLSLREYSLGKLIGSSIIGHASNEYYICRHLQAPSSAVAAALRDIVIILFKGILAEPDRYRPRHAAHPS